MAQATAPAGPKAATSPSVTSKAATSRSVTSKDGTRIAYEVAGQGPKLLIVNGALGYRGLAFGKDMRAKFGEHFTVIDYDRRGRGESGDTPPYSVRKEVEDIAALEAAEGPFFVFAQSSGAALALEAAAGGVAMKGLVAYEPPYMVGDPKDRPPPDFEERLKRYAAEGKRDEAVTFFMVTVGVPRVAAAVMRLFPFWKQLRAAAHTLPYDAAVMAGFDLPRGRLAKVKVPTIAVSGEKTTPTLKAAADAVAATVPGARREVAPRMSHAVKPKLLAPLLRDWLA